VAESSVAESSVAESSVAEGTDKCRATSPARADFLRKSSVVNSLDAIKAIHPFAIA